MTYLTTTSVSPLRISVLQLVANFLEKRREAAARRRTANALSSLNNHALKDLAINRSEILSVAYAQTQDRKREFVK